MYHLYIFINSDDDELKNKYQEKIYQHNQMICDNSHPDSGFDLMLPDDTEFMPFSSTFVNFKIKCAMMVENPDSNTPTAFYMYPRSSISKTHIRLANNVGIIDSGYRGCIGGYFDVVNTNSATTLEKMFRVTQICSPTLDPFKVTLVQNDSELGVTVRGSSGFGSTGTY
jgi:dUTP pyrophosphatase